MQLKGQSWVIRTRMLKSSAKFDTQNHGAPLITSCFTTDVRSALLPVSETSKQTELSSSQAETTVSQLSSVRKQPPPNRAGVAEGRFLPLTGDASTRSGREHRPDARMEWKPDHSSVQMWDFFWLHTWAYKQRLSLRWSPGRQPPRAPATATTIYHHGEAEAGLLDQDGAFFLVMLLILWAKYSLF